MHPITRRRVLTALGLSAAARAETLPPVRAITRGPRRHWFGYYDKWQFDSTSRYVLGMEVGFEHRSPRPEDEIGIGCIDTEAGDRWRRLGATTAWNWQQGCMLQWLPGSTTDVIWNERGGPDGYCSRILNTKTGTSRLVPAPIYTVGPDARTALAPDFRRLNDTRPGYGYAGIADPNAAHKAPDNAGIWKTDLRTGHTGLLFSFAQIAAVPNPHDDMQEAKHWFNHLLFSPRGQRFIFLHRWRKPGQTGFSTRLFTAGLDGKDLYVTDPYGGTSHFIWRDEETILAWAFHPSHREAFYLYRDRTPQVEVIGKGVMTVNGHCTYLPGNRWILNDTYPDRERLQHPYLYEVATGRRVPLGHFSSPREYAGEWRCDNHPRFSPDGKKVVIDSPHGGDGRQMYLIDVSGIVG